MKRIYLLTVCFALTSLTAYAQFEDGTFWQQGGDGNIAFSQTTFSNWAEGGEDALNLNLLSGFFANHKNGRTVWDNLLTVGYGLQKQGDQDIRKSDDQIDLISKYGYGTADSSKWYYSGLFNFNSQITNTYEYPEDAAKNLISQFLSPGNFKLGLGMDYKPDETFSLFISPLTGDLILIDNQSIANLGIHGNEVVNEIGEKEKWGLGALLTALLNRDLSENLNYKGKLSLFADYLNNPQNVDIKWENLFTTQVWKILTITLAGELRYDHDVLIPVDRNNDGVIDENDGVGGRRTQFKEVFGVGIGYSF